MFFYMVSGKGSQNQTQDYLFPKLAEYNGSTASAYITNILKEAVALDGLGNLKIHNFYAQLAIARLYLEYRTD